MIAKTFPAHHIRKGELTNFAALIEKQIKKHTLRANYELWKKRSDEINQGKAYLSVRQWSGKPYNSGHIELFRKDRLIVEKGQFFQDENRWYVEDFTWHNSNQIIAANDGLTTDDFVSWFKGYNFSKPLAIVHFTDYTYFIKKLKP